MPEPHPAWLFKHALVQATAYQRMVPSQRAKLHAAVASWLETEQESPPWSLLAWHWKQAGDDAKTVEACSAAGQEALDRFANTEALGFFGDALRLGTDVPPLRRARWHAGAAQALRREGRWAELEEHGLEALRLIGFPLPAAKLVVVGSLFKQMGTQILHRYLPLFPERTGEPRERHQLASEVLQVLGEHYYRRNDALMMLTTNWTQANHADRGGTCAAAAYAYSGIAVMLAFMGLTGIRRKYHERAARTARETGRDGVFAYVNTLKLADGASTGELDYVDAPFGEASALYPKLGDSFNHELTLSLLAFSRMHMGRFDESRALAEQLWASAHPWGEAQNQSLALSAQLSMDLAEGQSQVEQLEVLEPFLERIPHVDQVLATGLLAQGWMAHGDEARALEFAERCAALMREQAPTIYYCLLGIAGFTELYLDLLEARPEAADSAAWKDSVELGLKMMGSVSQMQAVCRPRRWILAARWDRQRGKSAAAAKKLKKARSLAKLVNGAWDERLVDEELARLA
ncbi:MAG: hypothetical protein GY898_28085 [Proteobacteria bacterium]|nr:hypothetical protein [Pseudomonadota bacterium]